MKNLSFLVMLLIGFTLSMSAQPTSTLRLDLDQSIASADQGDKTNCKKSCDPAKCEPADCIKKADCKPSDCKPSNCTTGQKASNENHSTTPAKAVASSLGFLTSVFTEKASCSPKSSSKEE